MQQKIRILFTFLLMLTPALIFGQPNNPPGAPVQGVLLLLLAGLGYGIFSLRKKISQK